LYNNTFYACYEFKGGVATPVTTRDQYVSNTCQYRAGSIDYSHFDTNPAHFYYDATNKRSDCQITDSVTARAQVILYAGIQKRDYSKVNTEFIQNKPTKALTVPKEGLTIDLTQVTTSGGEVSGVLFSNIASASKGTIKGKGQFVSFTLADRTEVSFVAEGGNEDQNAELLKADGTLIAGKVTNYTGVLEAGTYIISGGQIDATGKNTKQVTFTALSFKPGVFDQEVADKVIALINAIPATIDESAGAAITAARAAYEALSAAQKALVTNLSKLTEAETAFANIAVTSINTKIAELAETTTATTEAEMRTLLGKYNEVKSLYEAIPADKISQVSGYSKVTNGIAALTNSLKPYEVKNAIAALPAKADVTSADKDAVEAARTAYDALTEAQKTIVGDITKLTDAEDALKDIAAQTKVYVFNGSAPTDVTVSGKYDNSNTFTDPDGNEGCKPLKLESSTSVKITLATKSTVKLKINASGKKVKINGTVYTSNSDGYVIAENIEAGSCEITKGDTATLWWIEVTGA
ncbi:MAG: hypothetical protein K2G26_00705, partial [Clostridia bacterium]|nr:hypothetical protein [Clostridia bacterium]